MDMPVLEVAGGTISLNQGGKAKDYFSLARGEQVVGLVPLEKVLAVATAQGRIKRINPDYPANRDEWEVIALKEKDTVVAAVPSADESDQMVLITAGAQLLRFGADKVRPQGRTGSGIAGIKLAPGDEVIGFGAIPAAVADAPGAAVVVTAAAGDGTLEGLESGTIKVSELSEFPIKGRATGGVRAHRFLRGEERLMLGAAVLAAPMAADSSGSARTLPAEMARRDASGVALEQRITAVASSPEALSSVYAPRHR